VYFPRHSLKDALKVATSIWEKNAGNPFAIIDIAAHVGYSPTSSGYRDYLRSSVRYGLTTGSWQNDLSKTISLTPLGSSIVAPSTGDDPNAAMRRALETPEIFREIYRSINGKIIPPPDVMKNTLVKTYRLSKEDADACLAVIIKNIQELGLAQDVQGRNYLRLDKLSVEAPRLVEPPGVAETSPGLAVEGQTQHPVPLGEELKPKKIFVAHGKNKKPLQQLEKILTQFKVPFQVAIDEPHRGRAISAKVADSMRECTSGIFIFTADEETTDSQGGKVLRPNDNVVFELGAGTILYGQKIVIFREEGVSFGSDFTDYGHITFEKDKLDAKAFDLMKELIAQGFLQVSPT